MCEKGKGGLRGMGEEVEWEWVEKNVPICQVLTLPPPHSLIRDDVEC